MRIYTLIFVCCLFLVSLQSKAQESDFLTDQLESLSIGSAMIGKAMPPPDTKGSYFLDDDWSDNGSIELYVGKPIDNVQLKYNINANLIYVKLKDSNENFFIEGSKVKTFTIGEKEYGLGRTFLNVSELFKDKPKSEGFYELFKAGEPFSILIHNYTFLKKANYMKGADMGRRDNEILKKADYFIFDGKDLHKVSASKTRILEVFGDKKNDIRDYAKANSLNLKDPADLAKVITYYNSL